MATLGQVLEAQTIEGEVYRKLDGGWVQCFSCGHECRIPDGALGVCKVRFNRGGKLLVPYGYVGGVQCDPVEKKPYFHVRPGALAFSFGMLGCDLHCAYCFTGDTLVVTDRGPQTFEEIFQHGVRVVNRPDADIALPDDGLCAVAASGQLRNVRGIFRHPYRGELLTIRPYYLQPLRCTPDHHIYATADPGLPLAPIEARHLTAEHYLAIPRCYDFSSWYERSTVERNIIETDEFHLIPMRDVTAAEYEGDVYNMDVEEEHNYLAGFLLVSNCQNWVTSQALRDPDAVAPPLRTTPEQLVEMALAQGGEIVVSTYNEPLITSEWSIAIFKQARAAGLLTGFVSNGNGTPQVLEYIRPWVDAYKVDLKSFDDRHYRELGGRIAPILDTIKRLHDMGIWLEVLTLLIPGFNDSDDELRRLTEFVAGVSVDIPWHVTAFHKDYKMTDPAETAAEDLLRAASIGKASGLRYVYAGNLPGRVGDLENTYCPDCRTLLIERYGYRIKQYRLLPDGGCPSCRRVIPGRWAEGFRPQRTDRPYLPS